MKYIDTVQLVTTTVDGYGDVTATVLTDADALFVQRTGVQHSDNSTGIVSSAALYLDPANSIVVSNLYRLEGMYVVANLFGDAQNKSWYRITSVNVAQRKLLDNTIENIYCQLDKEAGVPYATYVS